jgi:transposase InsO family protein
MASSSESGRTRLVELDENNYGHWQPHTRAWVRRQNGIAHIEPPPGVSNPPVFVNDPGGLLLKAAWEKDDNTIAGYLLSTLTLTQKQHITDQDATAATIWQILETVHRRKGFTTYYTDSRKLEALKYVDGESMQQHLHNHAELRKRITDAGCWLPEAHYCGVLIASLPDSWEPVTLSLLNPVVTAATQVAPLPPCVANCARCAELTRRGLPASFGTLTGIEWTTMSAVLLAEEQRRRQRATASEEKVGTALFTSSAPARTAPNGRVSQSQQPQSRRGYTKGATCAYCRRRDHIEADCYQLHGFPVGHPRHDPNFVKPRGPMRAMTASSAASEADTIEWAWAATVLTEDDHPSTQKVPPSSPPNSADVHHWVLDSGASSHFCNDRSLFTTFNATDTRRVQVAAGDIRLSSGSGTVRVDVLLPDGTYYAGTISDVVFVPDMHANLLSMALLVDRGMRFEVTAPAINMFAPDGSVCGVAQRAGRDLWRLPARRAVSALTAATVGVDHHSRFGHADRRIIAHAYKHRMLATTDDVADRAITELHAAAARKEHCAACLAGKQTRAPLTGSSTGSRRASRPLELVHIDLCGPFPTEAYDGSKYLCVIVDDHTRYTWVQAIPAKSAAFRSFVYYKTHAEAQFHDKNYTIRNVRSDNGGEFVSDAFSAFLDQAGIHRQLTAPYTPQHNSIVERKNRTIVGDIRTTLQHSALPKCLWAEAAATSVYIRNRLPTTAVSGQTPFEGWYGRKPTVDHLRPLGCVAHVHIPAVRRTKLDAKSHACYLVGYSSNSQQYRLYDPEAKTVIQSRDVVFDEHVLYKDIVAGGQPDTDSLVFDSDDASAAPAAAPTVPAVAPAALLPAVAQPAPAWGVQPPAALAAPLSSSRSLRSSGPAPAITVPRSIQGARAVSALRDIQPSRGYVPNRSGPLDVRSAVNFEPDQASLAVLAEFGHKEDAAELSELLLACTASAETPITSDPLTYKEAMASPQAAEWQVAMESEMASLRAAGTYTLTECPAGQVPIGCKWVYATKRDAAGNVVKHKARLVAKGYSQRYGIDYEETYAPVCRIGSIRVLIALAAHFNWEIHHMDVTSAYLNGDLQETVYMQQPTGFEATGAQASLVCKLAKSLYGLKQAGRTWNQKIDDVLRSSGFTPLDADHCVYRSEKGFSHIIVSLYVDDLLLFSNDLRALTAFKAAVSTRFDMKDLGEAKFVLGMEIIRDRAQRSIALSQASYTREMLRTHTMVACNAADTPVQTGVRLAPPAEGFKANPTAIRTYQAAVGALMFAAICTRPDIAFAVGQLSQYASNPDKSHFSALTQCFRYLRGTIEYRLSYKGTGRVQDAPTVVGYSDADWAGDLGQRRSTTGYTFLLCGAAVSWQSKRQRTIAQSTVEAEYMAAASATKEAIWLRSLMDGIGCAPSGPTVLRVDNEGAIKLAENPRHHDLTKHIAVRYHLIRQHIADGTITLTHVSTGLQAADCFTKGLLREKHGEGMRLLGME